MYRYVAAMLIALAAGFAGGWKTRTWKAGADEADRVKLEIAKGQARRFEMDAAATRFEASRSAADTRETRIAPEVRRATENLAAAGQCLDADSLRILTDDAADSNARRQLAPAVPAASSAR
jgi:hypothetical protein